VRIVAFHADAFAQFTGWAEEDPKRYERLVRLIKETAREPFTGIGKPEPLRPSSGAAGRGGSIRSIG